MALTPDEIKEAIKLLKKQAEEQANLSNSLEDYIEGVKKLKAIEEEVTRLKEKQREILKKARSFNATTHAQERQAELDKLQILRQQTYELYQHGKALRENLKEVNKTNLLLAKGGAALTKSFAKLPNTIDILYGKLKGLGLFEMDKAVKKSALSMGLMNAETKTFTNDIRAASWDTNQIGVGMEELAKMQSDYGEELGRNVMLNQAGLKAMGDMAAATALGAEGTAKMAADMSQQGLSAESTRDYVEDTMNDAHKMGLNASKVVKNVQQNMKMLNKYNFKNGIKGLAKMAQTTTKLGVDMNFVAGMADKLFDIEGAVDMSAQLQVMGGEWAKMADPFHLMYMARNDMEGLADELGRAAQSSVHFNHENGEFEISALEMHKLRKVAEQTGVAYEDLATAGKNAAILGRIKTQISYDIPKDTQDFLTNTAKFDKNGKAYIEMDFGDGKTSRRYLNQLSASDKAMLNTTVQQRKTLEEYAADSINFDDALNNTIKALKTTLLPFIDELNKNLVPKLKEFVGWLKTSGWVDKISNFAKEAGSLVASIAVAVANFASFIGPKGVLYTLLAAKLGGFLMEKAMWITNGLFLAQGFNMGTLGGGATGGVGAMATKFAKIAGPLMGIAVGTTLGMGTGRSISKNMGYSDSTGGDVSGILGGLAGGAGGWALGAALAPETFGLSLLIPAIIAGLGAYGGSTLGKAGGDVAFGEKVNDGIFPSTDTFSKGRSLIQNGKITPIDNKDDLLAMKPNGVVDRASKSQALDNKPSTVKHEFGELRINGELRLDIPGNSASGTNLLKSPEFIRSITEKIQVEVKRSINQIQKP
jgi:hypothetical protein